MLRKARWVAACAIMGSGILLWNVLTPEERDGDGSAQADLSTHVPVSTMIGLSDAGRAPGMDIEETPISLEELTEERFIGTWTCDDSIKRHVVNRPDGTATMEVQLDFFSSLLYGSRMTLELLWTFEEGVLTHTIVSGTPKNNVDRLCRDFGPSASYNILRMTGRSILAEEISQDKTHYQWVKIEDSPDSDRVID